MSKVVRRKHVLRESNQDYFAPPSQEQSIVKIVQSRGNNLHEIQTAEGEKYLTSMPVKFRKNIWVKRGDFVIVEPIKEGDKVKAEMVRVLSKEHIKYFKKINVWPASFQIDTEERRYASTTSESSADSTDSSEEDDEEEDSDGSEEKSYKEFILSDDVKDT